ncbi:MAG: DNA polymerase III subunit alpha [Saprospiraceae bacterium]|nr:DNA polymerase III subunit alpha [Saprospiraceae bacterium]
MLQLCPTHTHPRFAPEHTRKLNHCEANPVYLCSHTYYSLRYGTLSPEQLVLSAKRLGITALALTDINNTSAAVEFLRHCEAAGIKPLLGIDFFRDGQRLYTGIARNAEGFYELNKYLSDHSLDGKPLPDTVGSWQLAAGSRGNAIFIYDKLVKPIDQFKEHEFLGIRPEHVHGLFTSEVRKYPHKLLIFNPITFLDAEGYELHRLLRAIDLNTILSKLTPTDTAKKTERPSPPDTLGDFYKIYPKIIENTRQLVDGCEPARLETGLQVNRQNFTGSRDGDMKLLEKLAKEGFKRRFGSAPTINNQQSTIVNRQSKKSTPAERLKNELDLIREMDFAAYFLITWDIVRYAQNAGYHHVGRGSGANSLVAYCLGITDVDPLELDLYFERFINRHRPSPPDFDIDFSWDERDDVTDYIFKRYGREHTALLATYSTFQFNAAIREVGKVFGLPKEEIDNFADEILKATGTEDIKYWNSEQSGGNGRDLSSFKNLTSLDAPPSDRVTQSHPVTSPSNPQILKSSNAQILHFARMLQGFPNHLSIHAGGVLVSEKPIFYHTALQMMPKGFPVTHFDMHHAEDLGFHKFDVLSQRGLGHIKDAVDLVKMNQGKSVDVHDVAKLKQDEQVRAQLRNGHCIGCFYIESPAMRGLLKKLRCDDYIHLVAASSIIRPGVAKSGMMKEYIRRFRISDCGLRIGGTAPALQSAIRNPKSEIEYLHPVFKEHLGETFGIMVYQEDVMKIVHHFAGLDLGEADMLRRLMSGKKRQGDKFEVLRKKYDDNCRKLGHPEALAQEVWRQVESFAGYSFCKAHSASYAVESFQSLYLKTYFPLEFMVAVINNFGGFYRTEYYFHEARMAGASIHAPCVNHSQYLTTISQSAIYMGFVHLQGLERTTSARVVAERARGGQFRSLADFTNRVDVDSSQLDLLIRIGAFRFTGLGKCELMWEKNAVFNPKATKGLTRDMGTLSLFGDDDGFEEVAYGNEKFVLPQLEAGPFDQAFDEIELLGFPLCSPFDLVENQVTAQEGIVAEDLPKCLGRMVTLVGYYVTRKDVRTVKKELMHFGTWLDREGRFFDTVHFPNYLKTSPFRGKGVYRIEGRAVEEFGFPSVEVVKMEKLAWREDGRYV